MFRKSCITGEHTKPPLQIILPVKCYTEPTDYKDECHCEECEKARRKEGVAELLSGGRLSLEPSELSRKTRNHNH